MRSGQFSWVWLGMLAILLLSPREALTQSRSPEEEDALRHARSLSRAFRSAAETAQPSVVTVVARVKPPLIRTRDDLENMLRDPRLRQLFPEGLPFQLPEGEEGDEEANDPALPNLDSHVGAGIILDPKGIVLTNNHVVQGADEVIVRLSGGEEITATKIVTDSLSDLAIVHIDTQLPLPAARLGSSEQLEIGDWVIAIGSPFELEATVSAGIISGKGRGIDKIRRGSLLQTDAAINPGNSGGPLVNLSGEVVGINTAIASMNGGYQGIGFAIPIDRAKWVAGELAEYGKVRRAYLGIAIDDLLPSTARKLGLPVRSGVLVMDIVPDGPAADAGLRRNDVIVEFAGQAVHGRKELQDLVEQKQIGSSHPLKVRRGDDTLSLEVHMELLPENLIRPSIVEPGEP